MIKVLMLILAAAASLSAQASFFHSNFVTGVSVVNRASVQDDTSGTTLQTPPKDCTGANLIVVIAEGENDIASFGDNVNVGAYGISDPVVNSGYMRLGMFQAASASASLQVTATWGSAARWRRVLLWCLAGASNTAALDGAVLSASGSASPASTAAITPSGRGGIIIGAASNNDGLTTVFTPNNGFTLSFPDAIGGTATFDTNGIEKLRSSGAQTPSVAMTATGGAWRMIAGAFQ